MLTVIAIGAIIFLVSAAQLDLARLDIEFLLICLITIGFSSRLVLRIPNVTGQVSISDTFIFLSLFLYGGEAATLLATLEAMTASLRFNRKKITIFFNAAAMGLSTYATSIAMRKIFGHPLELVKMGGWAALVLAICLAGLVQYAFNSGLIAIASALKDGSPIWQTWTKYYLWTSVTYFAGASAAMIAAKLVLAFGLFAVLATAPIIVYFTYRTYLEKVETAAAQAEQARRHVAELSQHIAEQEKLRQQCAQLEKLSALGELASGAASSAVNEMASQACGTSRTGCALCTVAAGTEQRFPVTNALR